MHSICELEQFEPCYFRTIYFILPIYYQYYININIISMLPIEPFIQTYFDFKLGGIDT